MIWVDYLLLGIIAVSGVLSFMRGFVREAFSLLTWLSAFFIAGQFYHKLAVYLTALADPTTRDICAAILLFIATLMLGGLINYVIGKMVSRAGLSGTDRLFGFCFGLLRGVLVVCAFLFVAQFFSNDMQAPWWRSSELIPEFMLVANWFLDGLQQSRSLWG